MNIFFSTVVRGAPLERGGEIIKVDWKSKRVLARQPIAPRDPVLVDPNPRGNARGGRGIVVVGEEVLVASYHTLHIFDRSLTPKRELSHNHFVGIHELHYPGNGKVWVTATSIDSALQIDVHTGTVVNEFWPREMPGLQQAFHLSRFEIDKTADNRLRHLTFARKDHLHLNALASWRGDVYALFNAFGAVVNLSQGEVVLRDQRIRRGHNLAIHEDGTIFVNDTRGHYVRTYEMHTGRETQAIDLASYDWVRRRLAWQMRTVAVRKMLGRLGFARLGRSEPLFVRGLQLVGDALFVGASPAMILQIDWRSGRLVDAYSFSRDLDCCVHGLWVEA